MSEINISAALDLTLWYGVVAMVLLGIWAYALWVVCNYKDIRSKAMDPAERIYQEGFVEHTLERRDHGC